MAYDATKPADDEFIAQAPADIRENFRALKEDKVVAAGTASKLDVSKTINITGDGTGSVSTDFSSNASIELTLANSGATAGAYKGADITVDEKGRVTVIAQGPAGFAIAAAPYAGVLASPLIHMLYACTINTFYIESHEIASIAAVTPGSGGVTLTVYKNGSLVYTKNFTVASTTDATANITFAAGDSCQFLLSAVNSTKMVTLTARGVRA